MHQAGFKAGVGILLLTALVVQAQTATDASGPQAPRPMTLPDGRAVRVDRNGFDVSSGARVSDITLPSVGHPAVGAFRSPLPSTRHLREQGALRREADSVVVVLESAHVMQAFSANGPLVDDPALDQGLRAAGVHAIRPLMQASHAAVLKSAVASAGATGAAPAGGFDPSMIHVLSVHAPDIVGVTQRIRSLPGVLHAVPNWKVVSMSSGALRVDAGVFGHAGATLAGGAPVGSGVAGPADATRPGAGSLPVNYGVASSMQSFLNGGGVNALAAYAEIGARFGQIPGQGTVITNLCIGDLTDQSMADAGDTYVQQYGPTTVIQGGQRYLDLPAFPLIPTFTVDANGVIDPLGSTEGQDPTLGEVLLDFSVMAPLPHDLQRAANPGVLATDLLGIAPGASYRLVIPSQTTFAAILTALVAAANQQPRPDVINMSLGYGFDSYGFPGRYLEDDPVTQSVVSSVVASGVVVTIAANDGTRTSTNAAIGPDGGAVATNLVLDSELPTSVADDGYSTIASRVVDSGAIAVGGSTLDDIFSAPPQWGGAYSGQGSFPETRHNGGTYYASGFGTRINVSAPSDNIPSLMHNCAPGDCTASSNVVVLNGGTSAAAPMTAAAAAVVKQVSRLTNHAFDPATIRNTLIATGRTLPNPPQADSVLQVGPQVDVAAAVESTLRQNRVELGSPQLVRISVAQRRSFSDLGATFAESVDPAAIDLMGPADANGNPTGQNFVAPVTLTAEMTGVALRSDLQYRWTIGRGTVTRNSRQPLRLLPTDLFAMAGVQVTVTQGASVPVRLEVLRSGRTIATGSLDLVFGPSDGTYGESRIPGVPAVVQVGSDVPVRFDLRGVRGLNAPQLVVSAINHWNPDTGTIFRANWSVPLRGLQGEVRIPASVFAAGAGMYGVGILTDSVGMTYGEFAPLHVAARSESPGTASADRPGAPLLAATVGSVPGHGLSITRSASTFSVQWDARAVAGADGALLEFSAPAPTLFGLYNTFTNPNGDRRDANGGDNPSALLHRLPGPVGTVTLDAAALGLPSSLFYSVRVIATSHGQVIGEASPSSSLSFDDGLLPANAQVMDFDIRAGAGSSVAAAVPDPVTGLLTQSAVYPYAADLGAYGAPWLSGPLTNVAYHVIGSDPSVGNTVVLALTNGGWDAGFQLVRSADGALQGSAQWTYFNNDPVLSAARVDAVHHRAVLQGVYVGAQSPDPSLENKDVLFPMDTRTARVGASVLPAPNGTPFGIIGGGTASVFNNLEIDETTGHAFPARTYYGDLCFFLEAWIGEVDFDAGTAGPLTQNATCTTAVAADQKGGSLFGVVGPLFSFPMYPITGLQQIDQTSLVAGNVTMLQSHSPIFDVVDPVQDLLLVATMLQDDYASNNNAMSAITVYDRITGTQIRQLRNFNFVGAYNGPNGGLSTFRGIQLDPRTRTGWTYSTFLDEVQQFSY